MSAHFAPRIVTANHLLQGGVIYLADNDMWVDDIREAEILTDEADAQLRLLFAEQQPDTVVGAYLAKVTVTEHGPEPQHFRDQLRRTGPSHYAHPSDKRFENV
ncbi:MAG: DUF2849 domain-containing protein [Aestuariivita sp.]|nr:DUF2849 domain-containing protein [Aestuariivita sp.]